MAQQNQEGGLGFCYRSFRYFYRALTAGFVTQSPNYEELTVCSHFRVELLGVKPSL